MAGGEDVPQHSMVPQLPAVRCDGQIQSQLQAESSPSHSFLWSLTLKGQSPSHLRFLAQTSSLSLGLSNTKDHASLGTGRGASVHMAELWVPWQPLPTALHAGLTWHSGTSVSLLVNRLKLLNEKYLILPFLQH